MEGKSQELPPIDVESISNFEGNDSLLLIERLQNPVIKEQIIDLICKAYEARAATGKPELAVVLDPNTGKPKKDSSGKLVVERKPFILPTREEIEHVIDDRIDEVSSFTRITFTGQQPGENSMDLFWKPPTGKKPTAKEQSITEAHEKGHRVRAYPAFGRVNPIREIFEKGFDASAVSYSQEQYEQEYPDHDVSYERARDNFFDYLFSPGELAERMSQLKNYFGMKGDEVFTKEHLAYAREHYVKDVGFDNRMTNFFQAITPEKEDSFISLMNSVGI